MEIKRFDTNPRWSRAVIHNGVIYTCGQVATDSSKGISEQTQSALNSIDSLLEEVGGSKRKILSATIYLKNIDDFQEMNAVWDEWLPDGCAPARTCVEGAMADAGLLVEIAVVAAVD